MKVWKTTRRKFSLFNLIIIPSILVVYWKIQMKRNCVSSISEGEKKIWWVSVFFT